MEACLPQVAEFLNGAFDADAISPELSADAMPPGADSAFEVPPQVAALQELVHPGAHGAGCRLLGQSILELHDSCSAIFASLPAMLSSCMQTAACVTLASYPVEPDKPSPIVSCCKVLPSPCMNACRASQ